MNIRVLVFLVVTAFATAGFAAEEGAFAKANQAYGEGRFGAAAAHYESLINSGTWNANLFYDFGQAILNYERALALEPRHPEAEANLQLARDEARALELRRDWIERYASFGTVKQYTIAAVIAFWCAVFLAAHVFFARRRSGGRIALIALSLIVGAASIFAIVTLENGTRGNALAVVTGKQVQARLATADTAKAILLLPAGSEVKILSERGGWLYVALPNDQRGWIPTNSAERVRL
jgi:hypothetical protein